MIFHYQLTLSEIWVVGCYEILSAFRQRDRDAQKVVARTSGISEMEEFKSIFADLELLHMPMTKFEIAKDDKMKEPLRMRKVPSNNDATDQTTYDSKGPTRYHIMPSGMSLRGSVCWGALDHQTKTEYWVERRNLAERLLDLGTKIVPAGILEAQKGPDKK
jgi:hypothetical protein